MIQFMASLFLLLCFMSVKIYAIEGREIFIEWEKVSQAVSYDIELVSSKEQKKLESTESQFKFKLLPGSYQFRVRAKDKRGLVGPWSDYEKIEVKVSLVKYLQPTEGFEKLSDSESTDKIRFVWNQAIGSEKYLFNILSDDKSFAKKIEVSGTELVIDIPSGHRFFWSVQAYDQNNQLSDEVKTYFTIYSRNSTKPNIILPSSTFVREIRWEKDAYADAVEFQFYIFDNSKQAWKKHSDLLIQEKNYFDFPTDWPGGKYRITMWSRKNNKVISEKIEKEFEVIEGDRSNYAEAKYFLDGYFSREIGMYLYSRYLVTSENYTIVNPQLNSKTSLSALSSHLTFGGEKLIYNNIGLQGDLTLKGVKIGGVDYKYLDTRIVGLYRKRMDTLSDLRTWFGLFRSSTPEVLQSVSQTYNQVETLTFNNLEIGSNYWNNLTAHWGYKLEGKLLFPINGKTSSGNNLESGQGVELSVLGTYIHTPQRQIHFGYTYKSENYLFNKGANDLIQEEVRQTGHYLSISAGGEF